MCFHSTSSVAFDLGSPWGRLPPARGQPGSYFVKPSPAGNLGHIFAKPSPAGSAARTTLPPPPAGSSGRNRAFVPYHFVPLATHTDIGRVMAPRKRKVNEEPASATKKSRKAKGKERAPPQDGGSDSDAWLTANDGPNAPVPGPGQPTSIESKPSGQALLMVLICRHTLLGVNIAWTLDHMRDLTPACAGYLGFGGTRPLKAFFRRAVLAPNSPCSRLLNAKSSFSVGKSRIYEVKVGKIWDFLSVNRLTDAELALQLPIGAGHRFASNLPEASYAITMYQLFEAHPQCFHDHVVGFGQPLFKGYTGEDWYRACVIANCANRSRTKVAATASSKDPAPSAVKKNKPAVIPIFLDEGDTVAGAEVAASSAAEVEAIARCLDNAQDVEEEMDLESLTLEQGLALMEKYSDGIERAVHKTINMGKVLGEQKMGKMTKATRARVIARIGDSAHVSAS